MSARELRRAGTASQAPTRHRNQKRVSPAVGRRGRAVRPGGGHPAPAAPGRRGVVGPSPASASPISTATTASGSPCPPAAVPRPGGPPRPGLVPGRGPGVLRPAPRCALYNDTVDVRAHPVPRRWRRRPRAGAVHPGGRPPRPSHRDRRLAGGGARRPPHDARPARAAGITGPDVGGCNGTVHWSGGRAGRSPSTP